MAEEFTDEELKDALQELMLEGLVEVNFKNGEMYYKLTKEGLKMTDEEISGECKKNERRRH